MTEESEKPESEQRESTIMKKQVEALGVKVLRAKIDGYNLDLIRLTVPTDTPTIQGEVRRELARGFNGLPIPTKTWVWFPKVSVTEKIVSVPLKIDTSSKYYNAGYNLAIQGRIAPAVPAWTDQGQADFAQGYKDGQVAKTRKENEELLARDKVERDKIIYKEQAEKQELDIELNRLSPQYKSFIEKEITGILHMSKDDRNYHDRFVIALGKARSIILEIQQKAKKEVQPKEAPVFGLPQDTKKVIEEFGKPIQALPEKPRVLGAPSRQEQTLREARTKAHEGKAGFGQVTLFGAVSTSHRLTEFEEKPIIPQQPIKSMAEIQAEADAEEERQAKELANQTIAEITMQRIKKQIEKAKQRFA